MLRLDNHSYSPTLLHKIATAAGRFKSFADAAAALQLAGVSISSRQVQRIAVEIGQELIGQRDQKAQAHQRRQLPSRLENPPKTVAVEVDGGRIRTRAMDCGPGVHQTQHKEDKVACLMRLESQTFDHDPLPDPPEKFLQPRRVQRLVAQMQGKGMGSSQQEEEPEEEPEQTGQDVADAGTGDLSQRSSPQKLVRSCVASMANSRAFGPMVAAEAQERGFFDAVARAFVGDGAEYNWRIHRAHFWDFEPIVDFLHVLCYVYLAARGVSSQEEEGWSLYVTWMTQCWQGHVTDVIAELQTWQERLGEVGEEEEVPWNDPRLLVASALSYLSNNAPRMDYPRYRCLGLPTTSSLVESLVGEVNTRFKSKLQYWNRDEQSPTSSNCEAILQLRAALLSEDDRLQRFFDQRPGNPHRRRRAA